MSDNLKVCPFCESAVVPLDAQDGWSVKCGNCGLRTEKFKTRFQLKKYWDDRPSADMGGDFKEMLEMQREIKADISMIKFIAQGAKKELEPPAIEG